MPTDELFSDFLQFNDDISFSEISSLSPVVDLPHGAISQSEPSYQAEFSWSELDQELSWFDFNSFDPALPSEFIANDTSPPTSSPFRAAGTLATPGRQISASPNTGANCIDPLSSISTHELTHRTLSPHLIDVSARTKLKCEFCQRSFDKQYVLK